MTTVRAMKAHSGHHRVVAGRPLPPQMLQENPDEGFWAGEFLNAGHVAWV